MDRAPLALSPPLLHRRSLLTAALGAGLALGLGQRLTFAQTPAAQQTSRVPENAVAWPKFNLNSATAEQFQAIPGAGDRMTREFEEYRPYTSIAQFRGEIGKYVSPEEVAGFERYLFVPAGLDASDPDTLQQLPGVTADVAQALQAQAPFDSPEALKAAVLAALPPELATYATGYLAS